jgi:hypothetical protein
MGRPLDFPTQAKGALEWGADRCFMILETVKNRPEDAHCHEIVAILDSPGVR